MTSSILKLPTTADPLILNVSGHVPALKNEKIPITKKNGKPALISNQTVQVFYESFYSSGLRQVNRQGFSRIPFGTPIAVFCELWFFTVSESQIAPSDGDNAYQTLQELLMPSSKKHPYYLGVADDDKQVVDFRVRKYPVNNRQSEGARLFLWTTKVTGDGFEDWVNFYKTYHYIVTSPPKQPAVDFDEIPTLFT